MDSLKEHMTTVSVAENRRPIVKDSIFDSYNYSDLLKFKIKDAAPSMQEMSNRLHEEINSDKKSRRKLDIQPVDFNVYLHSALKEISLERCIDLYLELDNKNIGDIYITGSVALALQGKITRSIFKDVDLVAVGNIELDDDISDFYRGNYPRDPQCKEHKSLIFGNVPIDIFIVEEAPKIAIVDYNGNKIRCQHYEGIIKAKLNMALQSFKDKEDLFANTIEIIIK